MTRTNTEHPGFEYDTCKTCGVEILAWYLIKGECPGCQEEEQ